MYKIFIPQDKGRQKSNVRGFWKNPTGRVYYDYLTIQNYKDNNLPAFYKHLESLRRFYSQEAIFYCEHGLKSLCKAFIFSGPRDIVELTERVSVTISKDKKILRKYIKKYLVLFGGCSVYIDKFSYVVEAWSA